jgi:DNA-binding Lrp family transcriptional regulator
MPETQQNPKNHLPSNDDNTDVSNTDPEKLLQLLDDEYTQKILSTLGEKPTTCRDIAANTDVSRPTIYRRINKLQAAGILIEGMKIGANGHHRSTYELNPFALNIEISNGIDVKIAEKQE